MRFHIRIVPFLLIGLLTLTLSAQAQITINFAYNGTNTTLTYNVAPSSLSSLTFTGTASTSSEYNVRNGGLVNVTGPIVLDTYSNPGFSNGAWGNSSFSPTSFSGDPIRFFVGSSGIRVPAGFNPVTGTLAGTMNWTSVSLTDLGFISNATTSGSFAALGTTVNWSTTNSAIPEPSTYGLILTGLAALGPAMYLRRLVPPHYRKESR